MNLLLNNVYFILKKLKSFTSQDELNEDQQNSTSIRFTNNTNKSLQQDMTIKDKDGVQNLVLRFTNVPIAKCQLYIVYKYAIKKSIDAYSAKH